MAGLQADATLRTMLSLLLPHLRLDSQAIKLQVNEGGHLYDLSHSHTTRKWVTAGAGHAWVVYANMVM